MRTDEKGAWIQSVPIIASSVTPGKINFQAGAGGLIRKTNRRGRVLNSA